MTVLSQILNGSTGLDARETINTLLLSGQRIANVAAFATTTIPAATNTVIVEAYAVQGDAPPARYRRALAGSNPFEGDYPGARTDAAGGKWVFAERELTPEWFGAKGDSNGVNSGLGTDDAPAIRAMIEAAEALRTPWAITSGKSFRLTSWVDTPVGQRTLLIHGSNSRGYIRGNLVHDGYTNNQGSPMVFWSKGTRAARVTNVQLFFEGGQVIYPTDAVKPGTSTRGGITMYAVDGFLVSRPATSALLETSFQVTVYHSRNGAVDFGRLGLPNAPTSVGDDGFHIIGECRKIIGIGGISNAGDDSISLTHEAGFTNLMMEDIVISDWVCSTDKAKPIKVHIDNTPTGCTIRNVTISNVRGTVRGTERGSGITVLNELPASNTIENIKIVSPDIDGGVVPKTNPTIGTDGGNLVYVRGCRNVEIINPTLKGSSQSMVLFRDSVGGGIRGGTIVPSGAMPAYAGLVGIGIASVANNGNGTRRFTFSGTPDLTAIEAQLAATAAYVAEFDNKYPFLTTTGMTATQHQGTFRIVAASNAGKYVDVENLRMGTGPETPTGATGTIFLAKTPDLQIIDCQDTVFDTTVRGPLGWTALWIGTKGGTTAADNEVRLRLFDQTYGNGFLQARGLRTKVSVTSRRAKSGAEMVAINATGGAANQYNHIFDCHDYAGIADATQGYARATGTDYATDRFDVARGRTSTRVTGTATIPTSAAFVNVTVNDNTIGRFPAAAIDETWITLTPTNAAAAGAWATYDSANRQFVITLPAAPATAATFRYKIAPPI